jgi:sulfite reductase (NADPH) flavoprotein alpha-component
MSRGPPRRFIWRSRLSAAIAALEARRHAKLFYRVAPLGLTEAGSLFAVEARDILATRWRGSSGGSGPRSSSRIGQKHSSSPMRWREEHAPMAPRRPPRGVAAQRPLMLADTAIEAPLPLDGAKTRLLDQLTEGLGRDALLWLTGYLAGLAHQGEEPATITLPTQAEREAPATYAATVLYGSQTGHAERLATDLAARLNESRVQTRLCSACAYPKRELKDERLLLVIVSTQGDGDPPDNARDLLEFLSGRRAPRLESLQYAVLALGDSSYPHFCRVGRQVDARLEVLGARRVLPLAEADVDFETVAEPWTARISEHVRALAGRNTAAASAAPPKPRTASVAVGYTPAHPFSAEILVNQRIAGRDSDRDVCHLELLIENSGLRYQPGDSLGVIPVQADALVDEVLDRLKLQGSEEVEFKGETLPLRRWLRERRELTVLTRPFLAAHAGRCDVGPLREALDSARSDRLRQLLTTWQLPDLLARRSAAWPATDLIAALPLLAPRMYSIASSPLPGCT